MATQEDRSLSSGMSLPRWMKTKISDRYDLEQSAFSPTEIDDSFMYYYQKSRGINDATNQITTTANESTLQTTTSSSNSNKYDFTNHTLPCQKFLQTTNDGREAQKVQLIASVTKTKSGGTDDGFKGEAAKCGSSVIRVAHQMVAGKVIRGFNIEKNDDCDRPPDGFNPAIRRGSKSLPASPLTSPGSSPKSRRRVNKYFTGAFTDNDKHHGGWILSNLLSQRRDISQSVGVIAEEEHGSSMKKGGSTINIHDESNTRKKQLYVAKPSELREMNFWSPTSM